MDPELSNNSLKEMAAALHHPGWRCSGLEALRHGARAGWARGAGNSPASATAHHLALDEHKQGEEAWGKGARGHPPTGSPGLGRGRAVQPARSRCGARQRAAGQRRVQALGRGAGAGYNTMSENKHQRCDGKEREGRGRQEAISLTGGWRGSGAFFFPAPSSRRPRPVIRLSPALCGWGWSLKAEDEGS